MAQPGQNKSKATRLGPEIPAGLKTTQATEKSTGLTQQQARLNEQSVNGGFAANDPDSDFHERQGGEAQVDTRNPPKLVLQDDGSVMTDAPTPQPKPKPSAERMRKVELSDGPNINKTYGSYEPGMYKITREREKKDGTVVKSTTIRQDN